MNFEMQATNVLALFVDNDSTLTNNSEKNARQSLGNVIGSTALFTDLLLLHIEKSGVKNCYNIPGIACTSHIVDFAENHW